MVPALLTHFKLEVEEVPATTTESKTGEDQIQTSTQKWAYSDMLSTNVYMMLAFGSIASIGLFFASSRWRNSNSADLEHIA